MIKRIIVLAILLAFWWSRSFDKIYFDTDIGRDLSQISNIALGKVVWLGPRLSAGFPASPIYYYFLYPGIWLSQGNANSIFVTTLILATIALAMIKGTKEKLFIGLAPWWITAATHPGNGFTYVIWEFLGLMGLWQKWPMWISAIFLGIAISYHPAAIFVLPILVSEWLKRGRKWEILAIIIPFLPLIVFEFITKGFLTRMWFQNPGTGVKFGFDLANLSQIGWPLLLVWVMTGKKRWGLLSAIPIGLICFMQKLPMHYLLSLNCLISFVTLMALRRYKLGWLIIGVIILVSWPKNIGVASRTVNEINNIVNKTSFDKSKKIAVVSSVSTQADDYRFFLRMKGYNVLEVQEYNKAEILVEFIEDKNFKWQNWSTWEIEQAGKAQKIIILPQLQGEP